MKRKLRNLSGTQLALLAILSTSPALVRAQSVWDGGGTPSGGLYNWSDAANWVGDVAPTSATTTNIQLAGSTGTASNVDTAFTIRTLTFNSGAGAFNVTGNTISIQGAGNADTAAITNNSSSLQTISSNLTLLGGVGFAPVSGNLTINGNINMNGQGARFNPGVGRTLTLNGVISGTAGTTAFNGQGLTIINGANTVSWASVYVWNGTVQVNTDSLKGSAGAFGSNSSGVVQLGVTGGSATSPTLVTGAAVTIGQDIQLAAPASGTSGYTIGGNSAHISNYTGNILTNETNVKQVQALSVTAATGGRVNITAIRQRSGTSSSLGAGDNITKIGNGIVALAAGGTSTYAGTTTVSAGTLLVNGTIASTSTSGAAVGGVNVNANAVLGGVGNVNRLTTFANNSTLAAGDISAAGADLGGKLSFGAGLILNDSTALRFDLAAPGSLADDEVAVVGNFTLDGVLNITNLGGFGVGTYTLFTYSGGTFTNNGLTIGTTPVGYEYQIDTSTNGAVNLIVAVPEPTTVALLGLGMAFVMLRRRARQTRA
ncbi:PEP-CTERM protein-sorting domain-containing protein [Terrimicrobium sacchariphilum]|uniref:PEP-CTERM protein-sorting domain-containing protein n=1 Tax=Terrimicrobium sacchariphilum TaxID=690879 RepID=A0A146G664_TERSA|nr:PEP-CTERM sorting domain-containing protein [Terrimicrobium sacchariphilum]GAT32288.1 PEP-CTERM protein-sorting domain-containing protein [Terrimicrobium sacchariphilum]